MRTLLMLIMISVVMSVGVVSVSASNIKFVADLGIDHITFETDPHSIIVEGRTLIPLRSVSENLNMTVDYGVDPHTDVQYVRIWNCDNVLTIPLQAEEYIVNKFGSYTDYDGEDLIELDYTKNQYIKLEYPIIVKDGRTFVPIRLLSETFNFTNLTWDGSARTIRFGYDNYYAENPIYDALALSWNREALEYSRGFMTDIEIIMDQKYHNLPIGSKEYNRIMEETIERYSYTNTPIDEDGYFTRATKQPSTQQSNQPKFNIGDRVQLGSDIVGTVVGVPSYGKVTVAWEKYVVSNPNHLFLDEMARKGLYENTVSTVHDYLVYKLNY